MYVNVAILKETQSHERRVALVPSVIPKLMNLGAKLTMQTGAGAGIHLNDSAFEHVIFLHDVKVLVRDADLVLAVQPPSLAVINAMKEGAILISFIYAQRDPALVHKLLEKKVTSFAMERIPRISRAQSMDALSSQAALAGYYAVQLGATRLARILPKITTAAGAIGPAKVLVMGLGVAGLEAVATAHRLGAVVEGYDVRPETQEQVESLGATFVKTGVDARGQGGYARELSADEKIKVAAVLTQHIQQSDLVITTAAIPGKASPKLISKEQVAGMKAGAVIVDLSAEGGGNCEGTQPGKTVQVGHVTIAAPLNVPSLVAVDASELYAKNQYHLLELMMKDNVIKIDWHDEVLAQTALTHAGEDVLLAEAGVPYDLIIQLEDINPDFATTDIALVIGANDVVNPAARTDKASPIFGMPILNADKAKKVYVVKRGEGKGYAGIVNALFYADNCNMVYGDAAAVLDQMIAAVQGLGKAAA